ncbi:MAG TPA: hypothetical protein VD794_00550, partial [Flavisolibacter sp.]|nr:hypothetical protein [Flavisolibacter sp.]
DGTAEPQAPPPALPLAPPHSLKPQTTKGIKDTPKKSFTRPTLEEVKAYMLELGLVNGTLNEESEGFLDHHDSAGWKVGRNPMADWKAAVRTWIKNFKKWHPEYKFFQPQQDMFADAPTVQDSPEFRSSYMSYEPKN